LSPRDGTLKRIHYPLRSVYGGYILNLKTNSMTGDGVNSVVTKKLGTNFMLGSTCPEWTKFLQRIFDEKSDLISFIQRAVGYSLTGSISEQNGGIEHRDPK
jgi:putative DNA primase/helicase